MPTGQDVLNQYYLEMRWRVLSLAADLDRIGRAEGGASILKNDLRIARLRQALLLLQSDEPGRAEKLQQIFSDHSPAPVRI